MHGPNGEQCPDHKNVEYMYGIAQACFCLFTFQCFDYKWKNLDFPKCAGYEHSINDDMTTCQKNQCGKSTLDHNEFTTSFENIHQDEKNKDLLTIPNMWIRHLDELHTECTNNGTAMIVQLLKDGRDNFKKFYKQDADWQCIHKPNKIDVPWLHLHTFIGHVKSEGMPGQYPNATCVKISPTSKPEDDQKVLSKCEWEACGPGEETHEITETMV